MKEFEVQEFKVGIEDQARAVLQPDTLLASQYVDRVKGRQEEPERRLMVAVLEIAMNDYVKCANARDRKRQDLFREVQEWVESRDPTWLYSFENICNVLDLDADYVRSGLQAATRRASRTLVAAPQPIGAVVPEEDEIVPQRSSA